MQCKGSTGEIYGTTETERA